MTKPSLDRLTADAGVALKAAQAGGELMAATAEVVAARMEILAAGLADPRRADLKEMALMGSEKVAAFTASASRAQRGMSAASEALVAAGAREAGLAAEAAQTIARAASPAHAAQAQAAYMFGWWTRSAEQGWALGSALLNAQADAMKPLHKAATANAKRLRK
ncbi:MAG: phasin [Brevundimonas sp.]|nr:MAG: phasin [Brevundimonas sp.]